MAYYTYILKSTMTGGLYKGHTSDLRERLQLHNSGKTKSIKSGIPWILVYYEEFGTRQEAIIREKYFKSAAGRRFIKRLELVECGFPARPNG